jgi:hypothetical protein
MAGGVHSKRSSTQRPPSTQRHAALIRANDRGPAGPSLDPVAAPCPSHPPPWAAVHPAALLPLAGLSPGAWFCGYLAAQVRPFSPPFNL